MTEPSPEALELGLNTADPATLVVDLNCAFASIEQQQDPALRGRPLEILGVRDLKKWGKIFQAAIRALST